MMTSFDPAISENYSRVFAEPKTYKVKQDKLGFTEPVHYAPEEVVIKKVQEPTRLSKIKQGLLRFSEPCYDK